jgi:phosphatidylinositol alpha 1,6-mannosyltransferase
VRVAISAECFLPEVNGVTNSVLRVLELLDRRGHQALVIAPGPGPAHHGDTEVVRVPSLPLPMYRTLRVGLGRQEVPDALRRFRPHVVHLAAPILLGHTASGVAQQLGVPAVAVYQTDLPGFARRYHLRAANPVVWRHLRAIHNRADRTLAPSTSAAWQLRAHGVRNVAIWPRGVDQHRFNPANRSRALRRELAAGPESEVLVGYVGRLATEKRVHLLENLSTMPGIRLVIVGDGPRAQSLRRQLPEASFLGFLDGERLAAIVASLDVFVHTGADETFCQSVQEALASGVPVVAPAAGGPLDLVRHGENGYLYPPDDVAQLTGAVARLVANPALRARMGDAARVSVRLRTWDRIGDVLLRHYREARGLREVRAA